MSQKLPCAHAFKLLRYTLEKYSAAQLHPSLPSRSLAKQRHNPHPLQALRSLNLAAPAYRKQEEYSSFFPSLCCSTLFSICSHAYKGTHLASPILHHRANGACHQDPGFLHTSRVCDPALLSPESAWSMCPPLLQLASKTEESSTSKYDHATTATISRHPSYMQMIRALKYVTPSSSISF